MNKLTIQGKADSSYRFGCLDYPASQCPFRTAQCLNCGKIGHIQQACISKHTDSLPLGLNHITAVNILNSEPVQPYLVDEVAATAQVHNEEFCYPLNTCLFLEQRMRENNVIHSFALHLFLCYFIIHCYLIALIHSLTINQVKRHIIHTQHFRVKV